MKETRVTIDRAGRVVLPKSLRDELHLDPGETLALRLDGDQVTLRPKGNTPPLQKERGVWVLRTGERLKAAEAYNIPQKVRDRRTQALFGDSE